MDTAITEYLATVPDTQLPFFNQLVDTIEQHIAQGFKLQMNGGMVSFVVPHSRYPDGYHCAPETPLPFIGVASQKTGVTLHHMGLYANPELLAWFEGEYPKHSKTKLNMGKGCVRFKKPENIPFDLIAQLVARMDAEQWIQIYEGAVKR